MIGAVVVVAAAVVEVMLFAVAFATDLVVLVLETGVNFGYPQEQVVSFPVAGLGDAEVVE